MPLFDVLLDPQALTCPSCGEPSTAGATLRTASGTTDLVLTVRCPDCGPWEVDLQFVLVEGLQRARIAAGEVHDAAV